MQKSTDTSGLPEYGRADLDRWMEHNFRVLVTLMLEDPTIITRALRLLIVSKNLERIGDQVTNICEMIVYMVEGKVIKHARRMAGSEERPPLEAAP